MRGVYNIGNIKKTKEQQKKHIEQMNEEEVAYLDEKLNLINLNKLELSYHLLLRQDEIGFNFKDIINALKNEENERQIIEYNETPNTNSEDFRVLIRSTKSKNVTFKTKNDTFFTAKANICFVLSLKTNQIITVYWNKVGDSHRTIDWKRYNKDLEIIKKFT